MEQGLEGKIKNEGKAKICLQSISHQEFCDIKSMWPPVLFDTISKMEENGFGARITMFSYQSRKLAEVSSPYMKRVWGTTSTE